MPLFASDARRPGVARDRRRCSRKGGRGGCSPLVLAEGSTAKWGGAEEPQATAGQCSAETASRGARRQRPGEAGDVGARLGRRGGSTARRRSGSAWA
jgi:hypothetical protein